ncbi:MULTISPECIES: hypothetical protein [Bradyrhizobium]|uniref:hypothetical protein n=1 Tax=Bradyrhizobium TaxID=374 RepID=UPI0004245F84|nr:MULTISPECIES: hypothetical protein [Bradyrhizobium]WLB85892.1 hypothetical protein QIH91_23340 [Bradyrhizobium japonicum USDA 135]
MKLEMANEPGWIGGFSRHQARGAIPNGSRIMKTRAEPRDINAVGAFGTVLGSIDTREVDAAFAKRMSADYVYWVEWDDAPKCAVFIVGWKIGRPT